ncbi:TPA: hypothetical protein NEG02_002658 [Enterococcus faecium]|nr:hypothetical protein [Enterococcus faecium]
MVFFGYLFSCNESCRIENEFTNYYNNGRYWDGAYVWSVYDEKRNRFTVFDATLVLD